MTTMKTATPAKLRDGSWGARVQGPANVGESITVAAKSGKTWEAIVTGVVWKGDGVTLVSTKSDRPGRREPMGAGHGAASPVAGYARYCTANSSCRCYDCAS